VDIKQRNKVLQPALLFIVTNVAICCLAKPATTQALVDASPKLPIGKVKSINFSNALSETLLQNPNDNSDRFMREQLNSGGSNLPTSLQNDNSGWSQPIGWLFGIMFVMLGSIVAWSKYARKR
jgi:hypothetical protein